MSADAALKFIDVVMQHYPPFRWDEEQEKAWAATMVRELGGFSDEVITKTTERMVRTRTERRTPLVSECINACSETRKWLEQERQTQSLAVDHDTNPQNRDWTADRLKLASELMNTPMGKQASKEGWVGCLWSFARRNSRLPQQGKDVEQCKQDAKGVDEAYATLVRGPKPDDPNRALVAPIMAALERLGAEMLRRRHVIEQRVLGGRS